MNRTIITTALLPLFLLASASANPATCSGKGIEVQVLGSGGPEVQDQRASSSYLVWIDGKARVLVDSGGGSALRFGESGAQVQDLDLVLFTHLHADHSADFPALVKSSFFENRTRPLPVYGPTGSDFFPATSEFILGMFNAQTGPFRYLYDFITPGEAGYTIKTEDVDIANTGISTVHPDDDLQVSTIPVQHGPVPALAWRIDTGGKGIVFSGDMNGNSGHLQKLAQRADILIAHNAVPEGATGVARNLHMPPSVIGQIANEAKVRQLVLSHRMLRTLGREEETLRAIKNSYSGPVSFADDLDCYVP